MGRQRTPGLIQRKGIWHIDKLYRGRRICESTGQSDLAKAQEHLTRRLEEARQASVFGVRPSRTFRQAATKFLLDNQHLRSIGDYALHLRQLDPFIGDLPLASVHTGTLEPFVAARKATVVARKRKGCKAETMMPETMKSTPTKSKSTKSKTVKPATIKAKTINLALATVRRILNLAASAWRDENNLTWLAMAPKITMQKVDDARKPYPLAWDEQAELFKQLPAHLERMSRFKVNTGCRDAEVCGLRWDWEVAVPELDTVVFLIPGEQVKNKEDRLVVLNRVARAVLESVRGQHPEFVFVYRGRPIETMNNNAWQAARERAGLPQVRVHDLKHTFGRRLRAAGVSFEDRQDLLGHRSERVTTHYSAAELQNLIDAANRVCEDGSRKSPALVILKRRAPAAVAASA